MIEEIEDLIGAMVTGNTETNITVTYQDVDGRQIYLHMDGVYGYKDGSPIQKKEELDMIGDPIQRRQHQAADSADAGPGHYCAHLHPVVFPDHQ